MDELKAANIAIRALVDVMNEMEAELIRHKRLLLAIYSAAPQAQDVAEPLYAEDIAALAEAHGVDLPWEEEEDELKTQLEAALKDPLDPHKEYSMKKN